MTQQAMREECPPQRDGRGKMEWVDTELRVVSLPAEDFPEWVKQQFLGATPHEKINSLTFFYHRGADAVVLNRSHKNADFYKLLVTAYLDTDDVRRQDLKQAVPVEVIGTAFGLLDFIIAERRKHAGIKV